MRGKGPLLIVSGPSGTGKSTLIQRLLDRGDLPLQLSVSATTRAPREGEVNGQHYWFWTRERFDREVQAGGFLEHATVYGNSYGTLRGQVEPYRQLLGMGVILDIDVQGAAAVRQQCPDAVSVFLRAPSLDEYERRLRARGTEDEATIRQRLGAALQELQRISEFDHEVVNDDLDRAVDEVHAILARQFERG